MGRMRFTNARNVAFEGKIAVISTPSFLTDNKELTEKPSSVRQRFWLLHAEVTSQQS